jgi:hypothetical protein
MTDQMSETDEMNDVGLDAKAIYSWALDRFNKQKLPMPAKPKEWVREYEFPEDPSMLTGMELGQLMLRLSASYGYVLRLLGVLDAELVAVDAEYEVRVMTYGIKAREELGRVNREMVEAHVVYAHAELRGLRKRRVELRTVRAMLDTCAKIYLFHHQALSREQSRRAEEIRMEVRG